MKSTKFWIFIFSAILIVAALASFFIFSSKSQGATANIYQDGVCLYSIDLSKVQEAYTLEITGRVTNTIAVEPGKIRVAKATCPDNICVHQQWISNSLFPIVCLPNSLVIQIENTPAAGLDAVAN